MDVYFGENICQGTYKSGQKKGRPCTRKAYYSQNGGFYCGVHSNKDQRINLPKNPNQKKQKEDANRARLAKVNQVAAIAKENGRKGQLLITKFKQRKAVEYVDGFYPIFPNSKHGNRADGLGAPALSPMKLGPVTHIMPKLPPAQNLENFHQFAKVYPMEVDDQGKQKGEYFQARVKGYSDPTPHRHKYTKEILKQYDSSVVPLYSVFYDKDGNEKRYSYFGCRYFYCKKYEELALARPEFNQLKTWLSGGVNLQIIGYDGQPLLLDSNLGNQELGEILMKYYCDTSSPFGHEFCLATLLTISNPAYYPWNITYQNNISEYQGIGI